MHKINGRPLAVYRNVKCRPAQGIRWLLPATLLVLTVQGAFATSDGDLLSQAPAITADAAVNSSLSISQMAVDAARQGSDSPKHVAACFLDLGLFTKLTLQLRQCIRLYTSLDLTSHYILRIQSNKRLVNSKID